MAEALLRELLAERGIEATVSSAGTGADPGTPAAPHAVTVMQEHGQDLSRHQATRLTAALVEQADLILTMTPYHKDLIRDMNPGAIEKTFSLHEFVGEEGEVRDPFGGDVDAYRQTAAQLKELLRKAVEKLDLPGQGNAGPV